MLGCFVAQEWSDVRWAIPLATIWTGLLFIVSLYHLDNFDFDKIPVWIWLVAYFLDPLVGLWLIWANRGRWGLSPSTLPIRAQRYLQFQGVVFILLAAGLLLLPGTMADIWAWKLDTTLAQFYAGPMLAYGLCSFLLGWQGTWSQLRVAAPAMLIFTVATLIASLKHNSLFSSEDFSDVTWFVGFGLATIAHLILTVGAYRQ
jgi:branched-subunit amino acid transport protein